MKHLVRVVAVLGIVAMPAGAQAQTQVGIRVGSNLANLTTDPPPIPSIEYATLTGLVAGAFVTVPVNDIFALEPEVLYSMQGVKINLAGTTVRTKLDYIQVPLLARVRTGAHSPLAVLFGPSLGFKTRARLTADVIPLDSASRPMDDQFKGYDFGLVAGAAFDAGHVVLDGRYTWGLTDIVRDDVFSTPASVTDKARNRVVSLSAGLRF